MKSELLELRQKIDRKPADKKSIIESHIAEVQRDNGLLQARRDALQSMSEFVSSSNNGGSMGMRAQIEEMARSVPAELSRPSNQDELARQSYSSGALVSGATNAPSGIWELAGGLIQL